RVHDSRMRATRAEGDGIEEQNRLRAFAAGRSQTTAPRHHESEDAARLGTENPTRRRSATVAGLFPQSCGRRERYREITLPKLRFLRAARLHPANQTSKKPLPIGFPTNQTRIRRNRMAANQSRMKNPAMMIPNA